MATTVRPERVQQVALQPVLSTCIPETMVVGVLMESGARAASLRHSEGAQSHGCKYYKREC